MKHCGLVILGLCLALFGCRQNKCKDEIDSFKSHSFWLNTDSMIVLNPQKELEDKAEIASCFLVVYSDSAVCNPCAVKALYQWNALVDSLRRKYGDEVMPCFIFSPKRNQIEEVEYAMEEVMIEYPVYIDTLHMIAKNNPQLPENPLMHTFLVDKEGKKDTFGRISIEEQEDGNTAV